MLQSPGRGIGALTANGNNRTFAFSEEKLSPSIFVYIFPELQLKNELKGNIVLVLVVFIDDFNVIFFQDVFELLMFVCMHPSYIYFLSYKS